MGINVGIIGFGTVGTVLSGIFNKAGIKYGVYDILLENPAHKETVINKAKKHNVTIMDLSSLLEVNTYIISTVTTQAAEQVAKICFPKLKKKHVYIDCNSTSPGIKKNLSNIIQTGKADFIEGVILNAVNPGDTTFNMLIGGENGEEVADFFEKCNIKSRFYSEEIGKASMFKMLRSIFSKGVEVLLLEMLVAAKKAGIEKDLWNEITAFMDSKSFVDIGETWVTSHAVAYERRMHEMQQVITTMNEIGAPSILSEATLQYFKKSTSLDLNSFFLDPPSSMDDVVSLLADKLKIQNQ